jgi:uncharacterized membrane protein
LEPRVAFRKTVVRRPIRRVRGPAEAFTTDTQAFAAWYLFSHGLIKLALVAAVLTNRVWA